MKRARPLAARVSSLIGRPVHYHRSNTSEPFETPVTAQPSAGCAMGATWPDEIVEGPGSLVTLSDEIVEGPGSLVEAIGL